MDNTETANIRLLQNAKEIMDFDASELDVYARLTEAQLLNKDHPEKGLFIAESPKVIIRALDGGYEPVSVLVEKKQALEDAETIAVLERCANVPIYTAEFAVLTKLTGFKLTRGMLCVMKRRNLPGVQCAGLRKQPLQRIQCALLQGALQKQIAAGVAGKAKLRENRQLYPPLRGSLQLCQHLLCIIGAVCHPQRGRKSSRL